MEKQVTLVFTVDENKAESLVSDEGYGSSTSPTFATMPTLAMTVPEEVKRPSSTEGGRRFRLPWGNGELSAADQEKRREKEEQAEALISSWSGRSLAIQLEHVEKILNKEKRRVQFGIASSKIMDLAIRRYSFK